MRLIKLTQGKVALIDDEDYALISKFKWRATNNPNGQGKGSREKWYVVRTVELPRIDGKRRKVNMYLHRQIMQAPHGMVVDHLNGDGLDCRRVNLRITTQKDNCQPHRRRSRAVTDLERIQKMLANSTDPIDDLTIEITLTKKEEA